MKKYITLFAIVWSASLYGQNAGQLLNPTEYNAESIEVIDYLNRETGKGLAFGTYQIAFSAISNLISNPKDLVKNKSQFYEPESRSFMLNFPEYGAVSVTDAKKRYADGYFFLHAKINNDLTSRVRLAIDEQSGRVGGNILYLDRFYDIKYLEGDLYTLESRPVEILTPPFVECDTPPDIDGIPSTPFDHVHKDLRIPPEGPPVAEPRGEAPVCHDGPFAIIKMALAYTPNFAATQPNRDAMLLFLANLTESVNEVYINSDIEVRARLAYSVETADNSFGAGSGSADDIDEGKTDDEKEFNSFGSNRKFNEIKRGEDLFNTDLSVLLTNAAYGGRAKRGTNRVIFGQATAQSNWGLAHEIGHCFRLEHERGSFSNWQRFWLDGKRAYGFVGPTHRTVMGRNGMGVVTREPLHSSTILTFSDGNIAGDDRARAREHVEDHRDKIVKSHDFSNIVILNLNTTADESYNWFAHERITMLADVEVENDTRAIFQAGEKIFVGPNTHFKRGSRTTLKINDCSDSFEFRMEPSKPIPRPSEVLVKTLKVYPNPATNSFSIELPDELLSSKALHLNIYDERGTVMLSQDFDKLSRIISFNTDFVDQAGEYFLQISNENKNAFNGKIIIIK